MKYWEIICIESFVMHIQNVNLFLEKTSFFLECTTESTTTSLQLVDELSECYHLTKVCWCTIRLKGFMGVRPSITTPSFITTLYRFIILSIQYIIANGFCDFLIIFFILMSTVLVQFSIQFRNLITREPYFE